MNLTLSAKRRKGVYALGVAIAGAALVFGLITAERATALLGVLYALTNMLALLNVTPDDDPVDEELVADALPLPEGGFTDAVE